MLVLWSVYEVNIFSYCSLPLPLLPWCNVLSLNIPLRKKCMCFDPETNLQHHTHLQDCATVQNGCPLQHSRLNGCMLLCNVCFAVSVPSATCNSVDIGITTTTPPALDIAALCLSSWPASNLLFSSKLISQLMPPDS